MAARSGVTALLKQGFHEVPDLMLSFGCAITGFVLSLGVAYKMKDMRPIHKFHYTIIRESDVKDKENLGKTYN